MIEEKLAYYKENWRRSLKETLATLFFVLMIRNFFLQPFIIPSGSMYPTAYVGDCILVTKFSYGFSRYSIIFGPPVFEGRIWGKTPERGDIVVFRATKADDDRDYIKRLVGMPGDRVQMIQGILHINGEPVKLERIEDFIKTRDDGSEQRIPQYRETLPNGVAHPILKEAPFGSVKYDNTEEYIVPEGHYFMMGDNRDNSADSRFLHVIGYVPFQHLLGKAQFIWYSTDGRWYNPADWVLKTRWNRIAKALK